MLRWKDNSSHRRARLFKYLKNISVLSLYARNIRNLYHLWLSEKNVKFLQCEQIIYHFKARDLKIPNIYVFFHENLNFAISTLK